jgi:hypothetical protein
MSADIVDFESRADIYEGYSEPNKVTRAQIKPYHETVVAAALRLVDPDNLIVLGPQRLSGR